MTLLLDRVTGEWREAPAPTFIKKSCAWCSKPCPEPDRVVLGLPGSGGRKGFYTQQGRAVPWHEECWNKAEAQSAAYRQQVQDEMRPRCSVCAEFIDVPVGDGDPYGELAKRVHNLCEETMR